MTFRTIGLAGAIEENSSGYADLTGGLVVADEAGWLATAALATIAEGGIRAFFKAGATVQQ